MYIKVMYKFIEIRKMFDKEKRELVLSKVHDEIIPEIEYNPESFNKFIDRKKHLFPPRFHNKSSRDVLLNMNDHDVATFEKNYKEL